MSDEVRVFLQYFGFILLMWLALIIESVLKWMIKKGVTKTRITHSVKFGSFSALAFVVTAFENFREIRGSRKF